jgi:nucleoside-diphosphate-sugar epimerase
MGLEVTALGRNRALGAELSSEGIRFDTVDLRDREATARSLDGQDVVFHCAALAAPWGRFRDFYEANVVGTQNVIAACKRFSPERLVHVSSPSVYMEARDRVGIREDDPLPRRPANAYAATKRMAEEEVDAAFGAGLPTITLRPQGLFGPGDTTVFPRLIRANEAGGIPGIRKRQAWIDITYVDNAVDALVCCLDAPRHAFGRHYNISNCEARPLMSLLADLFRRLERPMRVRPLSLFTARAVARGMELSAFITGREPKLTRYAVDLLAFSRTLDISAARRDLGFRPLVSLDEGLDRFAAWWKAQHGTPVGSIS